MTVFERYAGLIERLSSCNGTGRAELEHEVKSGAISKEDSEIAWFYVCSKKLTDSVRTIIAK